MGKIRSREYMGKEQGYMGKQGICKVQCVGREKKGTSSQQRKQITAGCPHWDKKSSWNSHEYVLYFCHLGLL